MGKNNGIPDDNRDSVHPQFRSKPAVAPSVEDAATQPHPFFSQPAKPADFVPLETVIDVQYRKVNAAGEVDPIRGGWVEKLDGEQATPKSSPKR
jgi:hypothetical protein